MEMVLGLSLRKRHRLPKRSQSDALGEWKMGMIHSARKVAGVHVGAKGYCAKYLEEDPMDLD